MSRRAFLTGRLGSSATEIRPPWAINPGAFEQRCERCSDCVAVCPTSIVTIGEGGFPRIDFTRGECNFCGECVRACKPGALQSHDAPAWTLKATIGEACLSAQGVECRVCGECCSVAAIRFRPRLGGAARPELESERCTGCGACFAPCPVTALAMEMH